MSKKVFVAFSTKLQRYQLPGDGTYSRGTIWNCVCCLSSCKWKEGGRKEDQSQEEFAWAWLWPMVQECGAGKRCVNHCQTRQCHWTTGAPGGAWFSYGSSGLSLFGLGSSYIVGVSVAKGRDVVLQMQCKSAVCCDWISPGLRRRGHWVLGSSSAWCRCFLRACPSYTTTMWCTEIWNRQICWWCLHWIRPKGAVTPCGTPWHSILDPPKKPLWS